MRLFRFPVAALAVAALCTTALYAQKTTQLKVGGGGSPHVRSEWMIDGANISIEYGRPSLKGRTRRQGQWTPYGEEWRTGADEATTLKTDKTMMFGSLHVTGRHLHALHAARREAVAAHHQQEDRPVGHPLSEGRRRGPRADDRRHGAGRRRAVDILDRGHPSPAARSTSTGAPRAPASRSRRCKTGDRDQRSGSNLIPDPFFPPFVPLPAPSPSAADARSRPAHPDPRTRRHR